MQKTIEQDLDRNTTLRLEFLAATDGGYKWELTNADQDIDVKYVGEQESEPVRGKLVFGCSMKIIFDVKANKKGIYEVGFVHRNPENHNQTIETRTYIFRIY